MNGNECGVTTSSAPPNAIQDLMSYLESLFETGMNWSNRGNEEGCWEVDHIMPLQGEGVDLNEPSHQHALCHYSN